MAKASKPDIYNIRAAIRSNPSIVLNDRETINVLAQASESGFGGNVIDMRGVAIKVLEARLRESERIRGVVASTAKENLESFMNIQRAILDLLDAGNRAEFCQRLIESVPDQLDVDAIAVLMEPAGGSQQSKVISPGIACPPSLADDYRAIAENPGNGRVMLRRIEGGPKSCYGALADAMRSEALVPLTDLGGGLVGVLAMASRDARHFQPHKATDLLSLFGSAAARIFARLSK